VIRCYYDGNTAPYQTSGFDPMVSWLTALGIVVLIEDHTGASAQPYTGQALTYELAWYSALATTYKNNPYVWFGTFNEPGDGTNLPGIWTQEQAIYNAVRNTGSNSIVVLETPSGGNPGLIGTYGRGYDGSPPMTTSAVGMTNIVWDMHFYPWVPESILNNNTTDISQIQSVLVGSATGAYGIAACQTVKSSDGIVPVIIGEFGNSDSNQVEPDGAALCQAVGTYGVSFIAWAWNPDPSTIYDQLVNNNGDLSSPYGTLVASLIAAAARA
jgi:hypothetical protein